MATAKPSAAWVGRGSFLILKTFLTSDWTCFFSARPFLVKTILILKGGYSKTLTFFLAAASLITPMAWPTAEADLALTLKKRLSIAKISGLCF